MSDSVDDSGQRARYWPIPVLRAVPAAIVAIVITFSSNHAAGYGLLLFGGFATVDGLVLLLATGTAFPVHAALWLVPFLALAGVSWRDHLLWAGAEAVHAAALFGWLAAAEDPTHGLPAGWYATALALRLLALGRLAWVVWARASWGPSTPAGSLVRLPSEPVDHARADGGRSAYPPVTERP